MMWLEVLHEIQGICLLQATHGSALVELPGFGLEPKSFTRFAIGIICAGEHSPFRSTAE